MALTKDVIEASELAQRIVDLFEKYHVAEDLVGGRAPSGVIGAALKKGGLATLGSGHYGAVLPLGNSNVLKVCIEKTDGYKLFAEWAKRNQGPGVPAIFYTYEHSSGVFFAAMPRYKELNPTDEDRIIELRDTAGNYIGEVIRQVLAELGDMAERDTHTGNFMYCQKSGMYVVTDPLARINARVDEAVAKAKGKEYVRPMDEQLGLDFDANPVPVLTMVKPRASGELVPDWAHEFRGRRASSWPDNWGIGGYEFDWAANPDAKWIAWDSKTGDDPEVWDRDEGRPSPGGWRCCRKRPGRAAQACTNHGQAIADEVARMAFGELRLDPRIQFRDHRLDGLRVGPFNIDPAINARR